MKHIFIINPAAGSTDASPVLIPKIRAAAERAGVSYDILRTTHPHHAAEIAETFARSGQPVRLYACGGDGTLNEVVQKAVGQPQISVGCVPCGSGNDYVRNFGSRESFLDMDAQLGGRSFRVDTIETNYGSCVSICAAGLDAKVAYNIPHFKRLPGCGGSMAYTLSILKVFFGRLSSQLEVRVDGETLTGSYMMLGVCNGRLYGGGYAAAPYAMMDDGLLDVVLVKPIPRAKIPHFLSLYKVGGHLSPDGIVIPSLRPYMWVVRAREVHFRVLDGQPLIVTLDGECAPQVRLDAQVQPGSLSILLPQSVCAHLPVLHAQRL